MITKVKKWAKQLKEDIWILYKAFKDSETPFYIKACIGMILLYALSPVDLIPDFIPILGYLDDLILLPGLIYLCKKMIPNPIIERYRNDERGQLEKHWYYSILIISIWTLCIIFILNRLN